MTTYGNNPFRKALEHIAYWKKNNNMTIQERISKLKEAIIASPYTEIGKPEAFKYELSGKWSRRIDREFIYAVDNNTLYIYSLKGDY